MLQSVCGMHVRFVSEEESLQGGGGGGGAGGGGGGVGGGSAGSGGGTGAQYGGTGAQYGGTGAQYGGTGAQYGTRGHDADASEDERERASRDPRRGDDQRGRREGATRGEASLVRLITPDYA